MTNHHTPTMYQKNKYYFLFILNVVFLFSCSPQDDYVSDNIQEHNHAKTCKLLFDGEIKRFDLQETKAMSRTTMWYNDATLYIKIMIDTNWFVSGIAKYKETSNCWEISLDGNIPIVTKGKCVVYYFDSSSLENKSDIVDLGHDVAIYKSEDATYSYNGMEMSLNATLYPMTGRIRFAGDSTEIVRVIGINTLSSFNCKDFSFESETEEVLTVCKEYSGNAGLYYSDYIYGSYADTLSPSLYMNSNYGTFCRSCNKNSLSSGKSGFLRTPCSKNYNGWTKYEGSKRIFTEIVDLGLSVYWAKNNIGAPDSCSIGECNSWGDVLATNTNMSSSWYCTIGNICGSSEYDRATVLYGKKWRLPNKTECQELIDSCIWQYTSFPKIGFRVIGKNKKEIFLPIQNEVTGYYWTGSDGGTIISNAGYLYYRAGCMKMYDKTGFKYTLDYQYVHHPIRPVRVK